MDVTLPTIERLEAQINALIKAQRDLERMERTSRHGEIEALTRVQDAINRAHRYQQSADEAYASGEHERARSKRMAAEDEIESALRHLAALRGEVETA